MLVLENSKKIFVENESLESKRFERKRRENVSSFADSGAENWKEIFVENHCWKNRRTIKDLKEEKEREALVLSTIRVMKPRIRRKYS